MSDEGSSVPTPSNRRLPFPDFPGREALSKLFDAEQYFMVREDYYKDRNIKKIRKDAVTFIETLSMSENLDALIPYTAMTYFDRFMSTGEIPLVIQPRTDNTKLFVICCLNIAWKLRTKNCTLSNVLKERKLLFSPQNVLRMEFIICRRLEWRLRTLTPFAFIEPFMQLLALKRELPSPCRPARELIVKSQADIVFTQFRPSIVATSALLTVASKMFPSEKANCDLNLLFSEFVAPLQNMVLLCNKMLERLYRDPPFDEPAAEERNVDSERSQRAAKEPVDSEIEPVEVVINKSVQLMNFELRWKEVLENADGEGEGCITGLAGCCTNFTWGINNCNIL